MRILVADDDPVNQEATVGHLAALRLAADAVFDGEDVLAALDKTPYDLILMDCQMPRLDGYATTAQIRRREDGKHVIIIALTGQTANWNRRKCREAGMDDFLEKPIQAAPFAARLQHWLQISHPSTPTDVLGSEFEAALIPLFLRDAPARLDDLGAALAKQDAHAVEQAAHRLKSGSGLLGASRLAELCEILENCGETGTVSGAQAIFQELQSEWEQVRHHFESKLAANPR